MDINNIMHMAKLKMPEDKAKKFTEEFDFIMKTMENLCPFPENDFPTILTEFNELRSDLNIPSVSQHDILHNMPLHDGAYLLAPRVRPGVSDPE